MNHISTSKFLEAALFLYLFVCLLPSVYAQTVTWSSAASNSDWNLATNWVEGVIPTSTSSVVINACTICPQLNSNVTVNSWSINTGGSIHLQSYTISSTTAQIKYATVNSAGGKILASAISEVYRSTFNGPLTIEKNGAGMNNWSGGNLFNGPTTISFNVTVTDYSYLRTSYYEPDIFYEDAIANNLGGTGIAVGYGNSPSVFKKKLTYNSNNRHRHGCHLQNARCEGEVNFNAQYVGNLIITKGEFLSTVNANLSGADYYSGNGIFFNNSTFRSAVIINNTNTNVVQYNPLGIFFGRNNTNACTFTPTASLQISANGFLRGDLSLERCIFQNTAATTLDLSSGSVSTHRVGRLIVGTGTSFSGSFEVKSPHLLLNGATFNQEATFTKTGTGINNSLGGNTFKKKITITNQADASSAINLATQANDIIKY